MAPRKRTGKAKAEQTKDEGAPARTQGSTVPAEERLWPHEIVDHVIADERALGASRRPPAVRE